MKYFFTLIFLFSILTISAQPGNDDCANALPLIQLDGTCIAYDFDAPTFDITNGGCATVTATNVWFTFVAQGTKAKISVLDNVDINLTILSLPNGCGDLTGASEFGCGDSPLVLDNLVIGDSYYVIVANNGTLATSFEMCILNPTAPTNDDPCGATLVTPGGCTNGTTLGADINFIIPGCPAMNYENAVFFIYQLGTLTNKLDVEIATNNITGEMGALLLVFPNGCAGGASLAGANTFYCGPATNSLSFENLIPGSLVYLMISSSTSGAGNFSGMCFTEIEGDPPCDINIDCTSAKVINIPQPDSLVCISGCTTGMPLIDLGTCGGTIAPAAWFTFNTGNNNIAEFEISSTDLIDPVIGLVSNCNSLIECNPVKTTLLLNTNYQVLVSDAQAKTGNFELCVKLSNVASPCINDESLIVTNTSLGSPLEGPYQPGEVLTFEYSTSFTAGGNCQWIHSFIPYFSDCWNNPEPQLIIPPAGTSVPATIDWYPAGTTHWKPLTNNPPSAMGINANGKICLIGTAGCNPFVGGGDCSYTGTPMPAGWVVHTPSGTCGGSVVPNESWGIPQGCGSIIVKSLVFTLKIPQDTNICNDPEGFVVGMAAFPDGTTGGWANPLCNGNGMTFIDINVGTLRNGVHNPEYFKLYPNPGDGLFKVEIDKNISGDFELYNLNGIRVYGQKIDNSSIAQSLDLNSLPTSIYNLIVRDSEGKVVGISKIILLD